MKLIADLHIHSRYSYATSRYSDVERLAAFAQKKGVDLLGSGDFTHPAWLNELQSKLQPAANEEGLFTLRDDVARQVAESVPLACRANVRFILSSEVSCVYRQAGKLRKIHHLLFMPSLASVGKLNARLGRYGDLLEDGRPTLSLSSRDLLQTLLEVEPTAFLIPAHVWTPWFGLFGSMSGFDQLEECFGDLSAQVFALETGLSSDPAMNRRLSDLDRFSMMSSSDAHSAEKIAREATLLDIEPSFAAVRRAFERASPRELVGTIEFFPEEGKYHLDGHRKCQLRLTPAERIALNGVCPRCHRRLTIGVLSRVEALADRKTGATSPARARPFVHVLPLVELIAETLGVGTIAKRVATLYEQLLRALGHELFVLREATPLSIARALSDEATGRRLAEAISRMRTGRIHIEPGFDGEYGTIAIFD